MTLCSIWDLVFWLALTFSYVLCFWNFKGVLGQYVIVDQVYSLWSLWKFIDIYNIYWRNISDEVTCFDCNTIKFTHYFTKYTFLFSFQEPRNLNTQLRYCAIALRLALRFGLFFAQLQCKMWVFYIDTKITARSRKITNVTRVCPVKFQM